MRLVALLMSVLVLMGCQYRTMKNAKAPSEPQTGEPTAKVTYAMVREQVLAPLCLECHNSEIGKAGLDLSTEEAAQAGVNPGNPGESLLYNMVEWDEMPPKRRMPPLRLLTPAEKNLVRDWIQGMTR